MKLYEHRDIHGHLIDWWTQRNEKGYCFSISYEDGKYFVIINPDDANRRIFAVTRTFADAEAYLQKAVKIYS